MVLVNRRQFIRAGGAAGVVGVTGLSGCLGGITGGGGMPTIRIAYVGPISLPSPMGVPEIQDELDNMGDAYELELVNIPSSPEGLNQLSAGELDITNAAFSSFPNAVNNDITETPINIVGIGGYVGHEDWFKLPWLALSESGIDSVEDLAGGNVGLNSLGTGVHAAAEKMFTDVGMTAGEDFEYVEIPFPAMESAIDEGRVDAGTIPPSFGAAIRNNLDVTTVFSARDAFGSAFPFIFNVTTSANIEEQTEAYQAWGEDYVQMIQFNKENREQVIPWLSEFFDIPEPVIDAFWIREGADYWVPDDGTVDGGQLQRVMNALESIGFIDNAPSVDDHLRNDLMG